MIESKPLLQRLASTKLAWAGERFGVLAQNLANADTPGYQARDVVKPNFERMVAAQGAGQTTKLATTRIGHLSPLGEPSTSFRTREVDSFETSPTGNGVVIEEQMQKLGETQTDYRLAANVYGKFKGFLRTAIGDTRA
ncbi:MAG: flagellar basal body protein [Pseudomonadota bacterium]